MPICQCCYEEKGKLKDCNKCKKKICKDCEIERQTKIYCVGCYSDKYTIDFLGIEIELKR